MRVLIAGDWSSELHEEPIARSLARQGHEVIKFKWYTYFQQNGFILIRILKRLQNKFLVGGLILKLNRDLEDVVRKNKPNLVFIYRGTHVLRITLRKLKSIDSDLVIFGFNNDDPFSPFYPFWIWRHFISCIQSYDVILAYRESNIPEYFAAGARRVSLWRAYFDPARNYPIKADSVSEEWRCDVVFIGHYENDGRLTYLEEVVKNGWSLRIYGPPYEWNDILERNSILKSLSPVRLVWGEDYNYAINGAKIALCFLSKLNRDTYTRRCFEIPASGTLLVSERSDDLTKIFRPDDEVVLFGNVPEFRCVLSSLLTDLERLKAVAGAGSRRVWADRHDVDSRVADLLNHYRTIKGGNICA